MSDLPLTVQVVLPQGALESLARALAAELRVEGPPPASRWLSGAQAAADYLGWPKARVHRFVKELPHYRAGGRLMFRPEELDAWVSAHREGFQPDLVQQSGSRELLRDNGVEAPPPFQNRSKADNVP